MSTRGQLDVLDIVSHYAAGYFPLYDLSGQFYWERLGVRAVLHVDAATSEKARHMIHASERRMKQHDRFIMRYTSAVPQVIAHLRDAGEGGVKSNSWVRGEVIRIYEALHDAGLLQTIEAWRVHPGQSRLVGALLGLVFPGTFIAETMFGLVPEASKRCLCQLVLDCWHATQQNAAPFAMIDVQTPHDLDELGRRMHIEGRTAHPCIRLGEESMTLAAFRRAFQEAWKRGFPGGVREWVAAAAAVRQLARGATAHHSDILPPHAFNRARAYLQYT